MKFAITGLFTLFAARKSSAQPFDTPPTTEEPPLFLPLPALSFTKAPAIIQARPELTLTRDATRALLVFTTIQSPSQVESALQPLGLVLEDHPDQCGTSLARPQERVVHAPTQFWIRSLNCQSVITQQTLLRLIPLFGQDLEWIGPVYKDPMARDRGAFTCAMPNVLLIKLRTGFTSEEARRFADDFANFGAQETADIGPSRFRRHRIRNNSRKTAYELRDQYLSPPWNQIVERVLFSYLPMLSTLAMVPRDIKYMPVSADNYEGQWNMWKIQAGDNPSTCMSSPSTLTGWDIWKGSRSVIIWLLDIGCDERHPDLRLFSQGMDFRQSMPFLGTTPRDISALAEVYKPRGDHGTWCAGVLSASISSSSVPCNTAADGVGVAGVAGECRVFPLAVQPNPPADEFAEAISYASNHTTPSGGVTAKIINISVSNTWITDPVSMKRHPMYWYDYDILVEPALDQAIAAGMIICAPSGNSANVSSFTSVAYPASKPGVLACGASDQSDIRIERSTWASCYGPELSVVAPGISIPTTHPNNEYFYTFAKTSAATPHVAGLAALLLSYKTCLNTKAVIDTIEKTADKVHNGTRYTYQNRPNGLWNEQVGYGRINVKRALESLGSQCPSDTGPPAAPTNLTVK